MPSTEPSATSLILARELVEAKGGMRLFTPVISGVIEYHRNLFTQTNPNLARDLNEVAQKMHAELAAREPLEPRQQEQIPARVEVAVEPGRLDQRAHARARFPWMQAGIEAVDLDPSRIGQRQPERDAHALTRR